MADLSAQSAGSSVSSLIVPESLESKIGIIIQAPKGEKANFDKLWEQIGTNWSSDEAKPLRTQIRKHHVIMLNDFNEFIKKNVKDVKKTTKEEDVKVAELVTEKGYKIGLNTYVVVIKDGKQFRNLICVNLPKLKAELAEATGADTIKKQGKSGK